jgi:hypothetical protein
MRAKINKAIAHLGLEIQGGNGSGCFYFTNADGALNADSVMVSAMTHLPVSRWVAEAESALEQDGQNHKPLQELVPVIKLSARIY